ncbi:hypothetical protein RUM44_009809 [Polyplax serrata]|uniref:Uncharacterized protein n=1 Tax=Polyplax serrata TaxID=468196 RepID=A0ABR1AVH4_POLSC
MAHLKCLLFQYVLIANGFFQVLSHTEFKPEITRAEPTVQTEVNQDSVKVSTPPVHESTEKQVELHINHTTTNASIQAYLRNVTQIQLNISSTTKLPCSTTQMTPSTDNEGIKKVTALELLNTERQERVKSINSTERYPIPNKKIANSKFDQTTQFNSDVHSVTTVTENFITNALPMPNATFLTTGEKSILSKTTNYLYYTEENNSTAPMEQTTNPTGETEVTEDIIEKQINEAINSMPKLPELILSDNKTHFKFHKSSEEMLIDEKITQIARQLAEKSLRQRYEELKLGGTQSPASISQTEPFDSEPITFVPEYQNMSTPTTLQQPEKATAPLQVKNATRDSTPTTQATNLNQNGFHVRTNLSHILKVNKSNDQIKEIDEMLKSKDEPTQIQPTSLSQLLSNSSSKS